MSKPIVAEIDKRLHGFRRAQSYNPKLRGYSPIIYLGHEEYYDLVSTCHPADLNDGCYRGHVVIEVGKQSHINIAIDREF